MHDKELIDKILLNDHSAFELLIKKYQSLVYNTCIRLLKNPSDAEDMSQEVFLEVFRSVVQIRNVEDVAGWIYRISYCKCISFHRKHNPAKDNSRPEKGSASTLIEQNAGHADYETPDVTLEKKEAGIELFKRIDELPEMQKKAILLHKFEGYSHKEICDEMGLSQASVESLIYRAKQSLRKSLVSFFENY